MLFRHRVDTARMPGMTATDAAQCKPAAAQQAEALDRRNRILGTGRRKPAVITQPGADHHAVAFNEYQNQCAHALRLYASECPVR